MNPENPLPPNSDSTPRGAPADPRITIEGYSLVRELNRGGQAVIYLAVQKSTGRKVAIKFLREGPLGSAVEKNRMEREAKILAELDHPNIVKVIDRGETPEGWSYFVLEYLHGKILAEHLDDYRQRQTTGEPTTPDLTELLRLFIRICDAINAAHLRGIVHRDLKPSNILIDNYGEPHVLDFGLARGAISWASPEDQSQLPTMSGEFVGSLPWASPEQAEGIISKIDTRSDVYALGVILYEMITGEFPYEVFGKLPDVLDNIRHKPPKPPSRVLEAKRAESDDARPRTRRVAIPVSPALDAVVLKALAKSREERYQTAGELSHDLARCLDGQTTLAGQAAVRRGRLRAVGITLTVVVALLAIAGVIWWRSTRPAPVSSPGREPARSAQPDNVIGYRVEGSEVVFTFDPRRFDQVRLASGVLGSLTSLPQIETVLVAGLFNGWEKADRSWLMQRTGADQFELRKPLSVFKDRSEWPFKFVVNGNVWVGAPDKAVNKQVVVEDTATYNILFRNPDAVEDALTGQLRAYRKTIDAAWPGQGAQLAVDEEGRYHFTFTHLPANIRVTTLEPFRDIPLTSLNLGDTRVVDFSALEGMETLTTVVWNENTDAYIMSGFYQALQRNDLAGAARALDEAMAGLDQVPAFRAHRQLMKDGLDHLESMRAKPDEIPARTRSFTGHHYAFIPVFMTWKNAKAFCESHRAHLATVTSGPEMTWITENFGLPGFGRSIWLGGTDEGNEGYWRWLTEERWRYENWTSPEPNNSNGNEHALAMKSDGWWLDANGNDVKLPFLMEWDP